MINRDQVELPNGLLFDTIKQIDEGLKIGQSAFEIPINFLLTKAVREHYSEVWEVTFKEYKNSIRLSFRLNPNSDWIQITPRFED